VYPSHNSYSFTAHQLQGLRPLRDPNMTPYGKIQLRTDRRLDLTGVPPGRDLTLVLSPALIG
jgi:hypothetical protein